MSDESAELLPAIDSDPDEWADEHPEATPEEIAEGNRLGREIDIDDDEDTGLAVPLIKTEQVLDDDEYNS
jgi:hypothetical protein